MLSEDFEATAPTSLPNCGETGAGFGWPTGYASVCEEADSHVTIADTAAVGAPDSGQALRFDFPANPGNVHCTRLFDSVIEEEAGRLTVVEFDVFLPDPAVYGGSFYLGSDGFNNSTDRGPRLTWEAGGGWYAVEEGDIVPFETPFATQEWRRIRIEADLSADTFDLWTGPPDGSLAPVREAIRYQSGNRDEFDRISFVHFDSHGIGRALFDNIHVETFIDCNGDGQDDTLLPGDLGGDCNEDGILNTCEAAGARFFLLQNSPPRASAFTALDAASLVGNATYDDTTDRGLARGLAPREFLSVGESGPIIRRIDADSLAITETVPVDRALIEIAADPAAAVVYGIEANRLYTVDLATGVTTELLTLPLEGEWVGLAWDPFTSSLLATPAGQGADTVLHRVDPTTTTVEPFPLATGVGVVDLAVDPATGEIVAVDGTGAVHRLSRVSGQATLLTTLFSGSGAGIAILGEPDCDGDGIPDVCTAADNPSADANGDSILDSCDPVLDPCFALPTSGQDCNANFVDDACEVADGSASDCDGNGLPDQCPSCPPLEIVFILDTSGSMDDEAAELCGELAALPALLSTLQLSVSTTVLGISDAPGGAYDCIEATVAGLYGTTVPGSPPPSVSAGCENTEGPTEDWANAAAIVAANRPWLEDGTRLIIPISDEGPRCGDPVEDPGPDSAAIQHAASIAQASAVRIAPLLGTGTPTAVSSLAEALANSTGGTVAATSGGDLLEDIAGLAVDACNSVFDCDASGVPDSCELATGAVPDCNANHRPDSCDIALGTSADCNENAIPDDCDLAAGEADCNANAIIDGCEVDAPNVFVLDNGGTSESSVLYAATGLEGDVTTTPFVSFPTPGNERGLAVGFALGEVFTVDDILDQILRVEVSTGQILQSVATDRSVIEIAVDPLAARVWATENNTVYTVAWPSGTTTALSTLPGTGEIVALAYDRFTDSILAVPTDEPRTLWSVNPDTGDAVAFALPVGQDPTDLAVDPATGAIYSVFNDSTGATAIWELNRLTGASTPRGTLSTPLDTPAGLAIVPLEDCNGSGVPDTCEIASGELGDENADGLADLCQPDLDPCFALPGGAFDCNANSIADGCELADDPGSDCDGDGQLDECPVCPGVDVVFVMDTSGSMDDEAAALCSELQSVPLELSAVGIDIDASLLGIGSTPGGDFGCLTNTVGATYGTAIADAPPELSTLGDCVEFDAGELEDWGRAVAVTAQNHPWTEGRLRLVVPVTDEAAHCGDPINDTVAALDTAAANLAASAASAADVIVSPIVGSGAAADVLQLGQLVASETGGVAALSNDAAQDIGAIVYAIVSAACAQASDCDANGVPDTCDLASGGAAVDSDENAVLDVCEAPPGAGCPAVAGDVDQSGSVNVADGVCAILTALWASDGGSPPPPACLGPGSPALADIDCSGEVNVSDVVLVVTYALNNPLPEGSDENGNGCIDTCE